MKKSMQQIIVIPAIMNEMINASIHHVRIEAIAQITIAAINGFVALER